MNLDKLKKLIRLANDNPNDHEANLAARKVCGILATDAFQLIEKQIKTAAGKMNEARTWNDVKRSTEPEFRSRTYSAPDFRIWEDFVHNMGFRPSEAQKRYWTDSAPHQNAPEPEWMPPEYKRNPTDDFDWVTGKKKQRKQEMRKCTKCGLETMTFRYDEVPWVCSPCHWKEYP